MGKLSVFDRPAPSAAEVKADREAAWQQLERSRETLRRAQIWLAEQRRQQGAR